MTGSKKTGRDGLKPARFARPLHSGAIRPVTAHQSQPLLDANYTQSLVEVLKGARNYGAQGAESRPNHR